MPEKDAFTMTKHVQVRLAPKEHEAFSEWAKAQGEPLQVAGRRAILAAMNGAPEDDQPQTADERALVKDALDLFRALAAHGKGDVLADLIKTVRKTLHVP